MKDKLTSLALKFGLTLLLLDVIMLFIVNKNSDEWVISWLTFAILAVFDSVLIIILRINAKKEKIDENK